MEYMAGNLKAQKQLISSKNILIIQDIDGVCIPLVKDPMTRELESKYLCSKRICRGILCVNLWGT